MYIFQELDKWAYDIEKEYENGIVSSRRKRQYISICTIRDRKYREYLKEIEKKNRNGRIGYCPTFKCCKERLNISKLLER